MLPARFHGLRNRAMTVSDRAFAEPVRLAFLKDGRVDPTRPAQEIEAILRVRSGSQIRVSGTGMLVSAQPATLHINRTAYPDLVIRTDDRVRALARPGQPLFRVSTIDDRTDGRLVLTLGEL